MKIRPCFATYLKYAGCLWLVLQKHTNAKDAYRISCIGAREGKACVDNDHVRYIDSRSQENSCTIPISPSRGTVRWLEPGTMSLAIPSRFRSRTHLRVMPYTDYHLPILQRSVVTRATPNFQHQKTPM